MWSLKLYIHFENRNCQLDERYFEYFNKSSSCPECSIKSGPLPLISTENIGDSELLLVAPTESFGPGQQLKNKKTVAGQATSNNEGATSNNEEATSNNER